MLTESEQDFTTIYTIFTAKVPDGMSSTAPALFNPDLPTFRKSSFLKGFLLFLFLIVFAQEEFGQNGVTIVPNYDHLDAVDIVNLKFGLSGVDTDAIPISIGTGPDNFVYVLTLGNGVQKRNSDGSVVNKKYITALNGPLDMAVDRNGVFYIADYSEDGQCKENGKIKIFDKTGNLINTIFTGIYRPLSVDVDLEGNIYVAEYNQLGNGCESDELSRLRIYSRSGIVLAENNSVVRPYRIAVNSDKKVYLSQEGNGKPEVLILDNNLLVIGKLPNIQSPGSVSVDSFDFIHVSEFAGRVDFSKFINFENLSFRDIQNIAKNIDRGIDGNEFSVKIYNKNGGFEYAYKEQIDFPVDVAFNSCNKMYVDNFYVDGSDTFLGYIPSRLEFDLEIYKRTPSFDTEKPVITCPAPISVNANPGNNFAVVNFEIATATDKNTVTVTQSAGPASGSQFPVGKTTITFQATDLCGNISDCSFIITVLPSDETPDTEPPVITCPDNMAKNTDTGKCGAVVNFSAPTVTDNSGENITPIRTDNNTTFVSGKLFPVGTTIISYSATDSANNISTCDLLITVSDKENPINTFCPPNITETVVFGQSGKVINYSPPIFNDNCIGTNIQQTSGLASGSEFPVATTTNIFIVTDASGNTTTCSFTVTIKENADIEKPVITCSGNITKNNDPGKCGAGVNFSAPVVTDNSGEIITPVRTDNNNLFSGDLFPIGTNTISYSAKDSAGNVSTCDFDIIVKDIEKPIITKCPPNITETVEFGQSGKIINYSPPVFSDNCIGTNIQQTSGLASGSEFPVATTSNIFIVSDASGNTATCSFTVTIKENADTEPPEITCPDNIAKNNDPGICGAKVEFATPTASDENGNVTVIQTEGPKSGEIFPVGTTTVTFTATDSAGNSSNCSLVITVSDIEVPTFNCPGDITAGFEISEGYTIPNYSSFLPASDNCDTNLSYTQSPEIGSKITMGGDYNVILSAKDSSGNTGTCEFELKLTEADNFYISCNNRVAVEPVNGCTYLMPDLSQEYLVFPTSATVTQSISIGTELTESQLVRLTATYRGETMTCDIQIDLVDYEYPVVSNCPPFIDISLAPGETYTVPDFTQQADAKDNCEVVSFTQNIPFGTKLTDSEHIILTATDKFGNSTPCAFNINISKEGTPNQSPVAKDDEYNVLVNGALQISNPQGVLANDSDADNDELSAVLLSDVSHGILTFNTDGSFEYTPDPDYEGDDEFTYIARDDENGSNTAVVIIHVIQSPMQNIAPVAEDDDYQTPIGEALVVSAPGILANDFDANGDILSSIVSTITNSNNGAFLFNPDGSFTFTPNAGFVGTVSFTYVATDGQLESNIATVTINVFDENPTQTDFSCNDEITVELDENGEAKITPVNLYDGDGAGYNFSTDKDTFTCEDIGENMVILSFSKDETMDNCSVKVVVIDKIPPTVLTNNITIGLNANNQAILSADLVNAGSTDNCEIISYSLDKLIFGCKDIGENTVILTATDSSGNSASHPAIITITGECDDVIEIPDNGIDHIFIYPNPTSGNFQIAVPSRQKLMEVEVYDMRGRFIMTRKFADDDFDYRMDLTGVQQGVYTLNMITSTGAVVRRVIIF